MTKSVYFDLFDDGLYPVGAVTAGTLERDSPLNTLRLQTLLAILFARPIVVPEQWAISSASFLKLARDVLCHYRTTVEDRVSPSDVRERSVFFPFRVRFFRSRTPTSPGLAYAQAFVERVASGRRIQLSKRLDVGRSSRVNERIRRAFVTLPSDEIDVRGAVQLRDALAAVVEDEVANWISELALQLSVHSHHVSFYDDSAYRHHVAGHVSLIGEQLRTDPKFVETKDSRIEDFRSFLGEAVRKQINFSDLTDLWSLARQYSPRSVSLIVAAGRYVLHRAVAGSLEARYAGSSIPSHFAENPSDYDSSVDDFFESLRHSEQRLAGSSRTHDVDGWLTRAKSETNQQPAWPDVWREVWAFSISDEWRSLRERIAARAATLPIEQLYKCEEWDALIEHINALPPFSAQRSPTDERYLRTKLVVPGVMAEPSEVTTEMAGLSIAAGLSVRLEPAERAVAPEQVQRLRELSVRKD